jgi:hydroxylysine kinase
LPNYVQQSGTQSTLLTYSQRFQTVYRAAGIGDTAAMKPESPAFAAISIDAPSFSQSAVAAAVEAQFGLSGDYAALVSERDQNFRLETADDRQFVVKVTSRIEDAASTDFQVGALLHLESAIDIRAPSVVRTVDGKSSGHIADENASYRLRVVTWVDGEQLETIGVDERLATEFGKALARLDRALRAYSHPGENPVLLWDLQRVIELRELLDCIDDLSIREAVERAMYDFEQNVLPAMSDLRYQVIHSDANPENTLIENGEFGFIDFGDIIRAPRIFDVAIASSYLRRLNDQPTALIESFVAGYHSEMPIETTEVDLLFDLVRARLATTITLLYWRLEARAEDDPYRQKTLELEGGASQFLRLLDRIGRTAFRKKLSYIQ